MIQSSSKKQNTGFSLIETLIYSAILVLIFVLVANSLMLLTKTFNNNRILRRINVSAETAMERMSREIKRADSVDLNLSSLGSHPGQLVLNASDSPTVVDFYLDGGLLMVAEDGGAGSPLTVSGTEVTSLIFRSITASTTSNAIKIEMELQDARGTYQKSETFYNTIILRGSY